MFDIFNGKNRVLVDHVTDEMYEWLIENFEKNDEDIAFIIVPNEVCVKYVMMPRPGQTNEYQTDGYYVCFKDDECATAFKLRFL